MRPLARSTFALVGLAALSASALIARGEEKAPANNSSFRYVDEKQPGRRYPVPSPDVDPTGLTVDELKTRMTSLEEKVERLEAAIARLEAAVPTHTNSPAAKERRP